MAQLREFMIPEINVPRADISRELAFGLEDAPFISEAEQDAAEKRQAKARKRAQERRDDVEVFDFEGGRTIESPAIDIAGTFRGGRTELPEPDFVDANIDRELAFALEDPEVVQQAERQPAAERPSMRFVKSRLGDFAALRALGAEDLDKEAFRGTDIPQQEALAAQELARDLGLEARGAEAVGRASSDLANILARARQQDLQRKQIRAGETGRLANLEAQRENVLTRLQAARDTALMQAAARGSDEQREIRNQVAGLTKAADLGLIDENKARERLSELLFNARGR